MRFCPFCAQETSDDAGRCVHCGRRLGARTSQQAQVSPPSGPAPNLHPTMLGIGPHSAASPVPDPAAGGPTTVGGPSAFLADFPEPSSADTPGGAATLVHASRGGDGSLEEDTKLPPPAPGLLPLPSSSFDPPTMPGIITRSEPQRGRASGHPLRGRAPVSRHPDGEPHLPPPPPVPAPPQSDSLDPAEMTTPMASLRVAAPVDPKVSQNAIPALPPPPEVRPERRSTPASPPASSAEATPIIGTPVLSPAGSSTSGLVIGARPPTLAGPLPVIPAAPRTDSTLAAVEYLVPVARGVWARRREQNRIRRGLVKEQQALDGVLLQLGRVAHEERLESPRLMEEMGLLRQAEERRAHALRQMEQLSTKRSSEDQRLSAAAAEQQLAIDQLGSEADRLDAELRQCANERRKLLAELSRIDALLRRLQRTAEASDARAARMQDPHAASQARAQGDSARGQSEALAPQREAAQREAEQLTGPISELTQKLGRVRSELGLRQQELQRHLADKAKLLAALDADMGLARAEQEAAEREMQQRMMTIGTLVNLTRPQGPRYQPLYQRVDQIKEQLIAAESTFAQLDTESDLYDRQAVQKGLVLLGVSGLLIGLVVAAVYIILALLRH